MRGRLTTPSIDQTPGMAWQLGKGPNNMRPSQIDPGINRDGRLGPQADCIDLVCRAEKGGTGPPWHIETPPMHCNELLGPGGPM